jgi:hypothetical protein
MPGVSSGGCAMTFVQAAMFGAGCCYAAACIAYTLEGRPWMAATFALYMLTIVTLYMEGRH